MTARTTKSRGSRGHRGARRGLETAKPARPNGGIPKGAPGSTGLGAESREEQICSTCYEAKPLGMFRRRRSGSELRRSECNPCFYRLRQQQRAAAKDRAIRRFFVKATDYSKSTKAGAMLALHVMRRVGGFERFLDLWVGHIVASPPGSPRSIRACETIMRLLLAANSEGALQEYLHGTRRPMWAGSGRAGKPASRAAEAGPTLAPDPRSPC